jgi:hypothetical protein
MSNEIKVRNAIIWSHNMQPQITKLCFALIDASILIYKV